MTDDLFDDAAGKEAEDDYGPIFEAQFYSDDMCCGAAIRPGQRILSDGWGGYIHEECRDMA